MKWLYICNDFRNEIQMPGFKNPLRMRKIQYNKILTT